jgi:polyisoprenoid-binding protein YceI
MKKLILAAALTLSVPAFAAPVTYKFDPAHTYPSYEVTHMGLSFFRGVFKSSSGKVTLDTAARTGSIEAKIDTASVDMGIDKLVRHLKSEDFFNVEKFPEMTFKSSRINFSGDNVTSIDGELTLLGVTKPVTLNVDYFKCAPHPMVKKPACGANASVTIKRSDFGMKYLVGPVSDDVKITIQVEAISE